jgi:O-acetyl-ADP-ribose deacetylase (regulator of RNase III)
MLNRVRGDILLSKAKAIAHSVAPNDDFKSGLALQLRERFPAMYKDFRHWCKTEHPKAGEIWAWAGVGPDGPVRIVALLCQEAAYGHGERPGPAHLEHVNHALKKLRAWIDEEAIESLALPRIATGVGRLAWSDVERVVEQHLGSAKPSISVYTEFAAGVAAKEPATAMKAK